MQLLLTILAFLVIFSLLVVVHELGHFWMAKRNGIKVEEFGFGLPPRIWGKKYGETLYSLNWIPFGGFVRMFGEDFADKKAKKSSRSYVSKTLWQRTQVVVAGVVMNFLLAWFLLWLGFTVGMQPLVVDSDDFLSSIREGRIEVQNGVYVDKVEPGSWAESNGFKEGDRIETLNGEPVSGYPQVNEGEAVTINGLEFTPSEEFPTAGLRFNIVDLPRVYVASVEEGSVLKPGDVIYSVNDREVLFSSELNEIVGLSEDPTLSFEVLRDDQVIQVSASLASPERTVISLVLDDSPAEQAGLKEGDRVLKVNGVTVYSPAQIIETVTTSDSETVVYEVERQGEMLTFTMTKNGEGLVGVLLSTLYSPENLDFSYYDGGVISSITEIQDIQYSWYKAPLVALSEMGRVGSYTAVTIGRVFGQIFTTGDVPDEVAGPVGIAQMTGFYVEEGFVALMRFAALLSLSLAVINIFPFPALDGGRLLFIVIELFRGKPLDPKIEGMIHTIGFLLLLFVIFLVTFQDIERLFS